MAPRSSTAPAGSDVDYLDRVRDIAPIIDAGADQAERDRRLPADVLAALHDAGLFRLLLPRQFGGGEVDPMTFFRTIEAVARHDASTAWCLCQANGCAMTAAFLEPDVANEIWGNDPSGVVSWGPGKAEVVAQDGGFRLNAECSFSSGMRHASWLGAHSVVLGADGEPERREDGRPVIRTMLFPANQATPFDIWDVIGLRATASDGFRVDDLAIPHDHSVSRDDPAERRIEAPLYQFHQTNLYATGFSGTAIGIARTMLESFKDLAMEKQPQRAKQVLRDNGMIQREVGEAEARLGSARAFILSELDDIWSEVVQTGRLEIAQRMRIRLATTYGIHEAKAVADMAYDAAGATSIFTGHPMERRFRDIHTVTQQMQGRKSHLQTVGAYILGHDPDLSVV